MRLFKHILDLQKYKNQKGGTIGFVPTMGALHQGHISLIQQAKKENDAVVCSIYVNPIQFNDPKDFEKYPITLDQDIRQLIEAETDILFLPFQFEMYPNGIQDIRQYSIGYLDTILDGKFRPGHFNGVCNIVHRLLEVVQPNKLYLGEKDFQQCLVIQQLVDQLHLYVEVITCPTYREASGLAMSSRNALLTDAGKNKAASISKILLHIKQFSALKTFAELQKEAWDVLKENDFEPEYILLADAKHLTLLNEFESNHEMVVLVAAKLEGVRLIDNMRIS